MNQPTAFVLMVGGRPIGTTNDLNTAQAAALTAETRYQTELREYRWNETTMWQTTNGRVWNLMVRNLDTNRWRNTFRSVVEVPAFSAT
jgi:hypothetical protein